MVTEHGCWSFGEYLKEWSRLISSDRVRSIGERSGELQLLAPCTAVARRAAHRSRDGPRTPPLDEKGGPEGWSRGR